MPICPKTRSRNADKSPYWPFRVSLEEPIRTHTSPVTEHCRRSLGPMAPPPLEPGEGTILICTCIRIYIHTYIHLYLSVYPYIHTCIKICICRYSKGIYPVSAPRYVATPAANSTQCWVPEPRWGPNPYHPSTGPSKVEAITVPRHR